MREDMFDASRNGLACSVMGFVESGKGNGFPIGNLSLLDSLIKQKISL